MDVHETRVRRTGARPLILGHRGASARALENTLEAFWTARNAGADGIELDVQVCATGEIVVFHDPDLARLAGRGERIAAMPLAAIREVQLGRGLRIPTLIQVLDELGTEGFFLNIEIKSPVFASGHVVVDGVLDELARHAARTGRTASTTPGRRPEILISSFNPFAISRVRRKAPHLRTGLLFHDNEPLPLRRAWPAPLLGTQALHPEYSLVTVDRMARWRQRGYAVNTWTVDDPAMLRHVTSLGVDAIITNDPGAARAALGLDAPA